MARVPLLFRGVAVLLLAASTAVGQTPEPPAEFSLDPVGPSAPNFLRQFSADARHPLLSLMVDGELASFETAAPQESSKLKPTPQSSKTAPKTETAEDCLLDGGALETACPSVSNFLPFCSSPPPCNCRKCQRQRRHGHGQGGGYGNPYLNWPTCPAWCFYGAPLEPCNQGCGRRRCGHRHGCGNQGYGYGSGGGWGMGGDGFVNGCFGSGGCMPYMAPQQSCGCRRCQRQRKHGCSSGYGYGGWGMGEGCYGYNSGCSRRHGHGRFHRCHQQPYPYCSYPMMSGMGGSFGGGFTFGGNGLAGDGFAGDGGDGFVGDGIVGDGFVGDSSLEPFVSSTGN